MSLPEGRIHIVGAGGAGMSAIAKVLLASGREMSGSDLRGGAALDALADLGMKVHTGHHPTAVEGAGLVVASSAVPPYDEELKAADRLGIPVWRRPDLLAVLTAAQPSVGATGTHGKTTTTALMITALRDSGEDPSFIVGGDLVDFGTNGHLGDDDLLVIEADEAFRTFESLVLQGLVVTNIEHEHVDHFETETGLIESFVKVARSVTGPVVACLDDEGSAHLASEVDCVTYGFSPKADWRITDFAQSEQGIRWRVSNDGFELSFSVPAPGRHIAQNATGAVALLSQLGRNPEEMARGLSGFRGVGRRWEHRGTVGGVSLYDDYAHHPTEVRAVLEGASGVAPGRLWAVFQPHLYSRTARFSSEFGAALASADEVVVTDVFGAREEPVPGVTGELIVKAVEDAGKRAHYVRHRTELAEYLAPLLTEGDVVVGMGAGDITLLPAELAQILAMS